MNDENKLIDLTTFIELLELEINKGEKLGHDCIGMDFETAKQIVKLLKQLKEDWIPVEKQLPMPYMEVQLRYIGLDGKVYSDGIAVVDFNGKWHWSNGEVDDEEIHPDVEPVEWRAIPEPYEVKE